MDGDPNDGPQGDALALRLSTGGAGPGVVPLARHRGPAEARALRIIVRHEEPPDAKPDARLVTLLTGRGLVAPAEARAASAAARNVGLPVGRVLLARGAITEEELLDALCVVHRTGPADLARLPPDPRLASLLPRDVALACEAVPWRDAGGGIVFATARPDLIGEVAAVLPEGIRAIPALATRAEVIAAQTGLWGDELARAAETRAPEATSCRSWKAKRALRIALLAVIALACLELAFPTETAITLFALAGLVFLANIALKASAFAAVLLRPPARHDVTHPAPDIAPHILRPPVVSLLVPLYREAEIAGRLVAHLARLRYAPECLDVILLVEEGDTLTAEALAATGLPPFMRVLTVPPGEPRTKPRALNYALPFAHGEIVGIYDAEDRPEPDQIARVVRCFDEVAPEVACLQGRLDYYNANHNLMAGLFTVEYASWFRVLLPGVQRLGLFVPLGGTTLFLRREALEAVGGWDAHNVTEDAELGLRLARKGYRTELIDTTTYEEANAAVLPWIRQRSRWLKGYLITWASAMRDPRGLWRDLGTWRFLGVQVQLLAGALGFFLAPLLWSLVLAPFVPHPLDGVLTQAQFTWLVALMLLSLVLSVAVSIHACAAPHLRHLRPLAPMVEVYYTLGTLAAWLGALELMARPFFWHKTRHGLYGGPPSEPPPEPPPEPAKVIRPSAPPP
jgi:glycosyltransferase XagB